MRGAGDAAADVAAEQFRSLKEIYEALQLAVDTNSSATRSLQDHFLSSGQVRLLMEEARCYNSTAFEIMQLLCYRNKPAVQLLVDQGLMLLVERVLLDTAANQHVQLAALFLLSAVCAFSMDSHGAILASKIIHILVDVCRDFGLQAAEGDVEDSSMAPASPPLRESFPGDGPASSTRRAAITRISCAVATLRNLCHNEQHHEQLVAAGVADVMCHIMHLAVLPRAQLSAPASDCNDSCAVPMHQDSSESVAEFTTLLAGVASAFAPAGPGPAVSEARSRGTVDSSRRSSMDSLPSWHVVPFSQQHVCVRINAAMAVAILVGHDEDNPLLEMDVGLTHMMLDVLQHACRQELRYGLHWTVWKLSQAFANLAVCDSNKVLILQHGGVEVLGQCLQTKHAHMAAVQRYTAMALWHLAFLDQGRELLRSRLDIVEAVTTLAMESQDSATRDVSNGCLWTLGVTHDMKALHQYLHNAPLRSSSISTGTSSDWLIKLRTDPQLAGSHNPDGSAHNPQPDQPHLMISYCWDSQQKALLLKQELVRLGFKVWMDVEKMSGSTLEAMALAVENSEAVLVCYSRKYKESQACRTEAEYAFQMRKRVIPILMEAKYQPKGWLGALLGTKLYFDLSDRANIPLQVLLLERELGNIGRCQEAAALSRSRAESGSGVDRLQQSTRSLPASHSGAQLPHSSWSASSSCTGRDNSEPWRGEQGRRASHSSANPGQGQEVAEGLERQSFGEWHVEEEIQCGVAPGTAAQTPSISSPDPGSPLSAAMRSESALQLQLASAAEAAGQLRPEQRYGGSGASSPGSVDLNTSLERSLTVSCLSHRLAPVERWTQEQVADWLTNAARLPELVSVFQSGNVDGRGLCGLMRLSRSGGLRACLKEDLGMAAVGQLLAFIEELHKLFD